MIAYFDCFSGISGDMILGALIDLGVDHRWLKDSLNNMPLSGFELEILKVKRGGITAIDVDVIQKGNLKSVDYKKIQELIKNSNLKESVKETVLKIFSKIAVAEALIHGCHVDNVHFHEVGAIDSIVDIVGVCLCFDYLKIDEFFSSKLPVGSGFIRCEHGILPVPVPATVKILENVPVFGRTGVSREFVTPTGAAIISVVVKSFGPVPDFIIEKSGYGAGKSEGDKIPNLLRIILGSSDDRQKDNITVIETNIDDMNPEIYGYVMESLYKDGAIDVFFTPVFMKKNRPGTKITVLCDRMKKSIMINRLLSETTSLGVRTYGVERYILAREKIEVTTEYGVLAAKLVITPDGCKKIVPEYEVCKKIAQEKQIPIKNIFDSLTGLNFR